MHKELLAQSPLLALPVGALLLFFSVFVFILVRTMLRKPHELARAARLPLDERRSRDER